jgi:hypothetical protein
MSARRFSSLVFVLAALCAASLAAPTLASADDHTVGLWGKARIGNFTETWQGDDPANLDAAFGPSTSHTFTLQGFGCKKKWSPLGMTVEFWIFGGAQHDNPCTKGLFGRARLTKSIWHTHNGISPGVSARKAKKVAVAKCGDAPRHHCGASGYILSVHRADCAGGNVPSVVARIHHGKVSSLVVNTTGCE